jgi:hypothetical protein
MSVFTHLKPVCMAGNVCNGDLILKSREICKRRFGGVRRRFIFYSVLQKECFMNKKIVAISILLLMMCAMAASVFAATVTEYEYTVSVTYQPKGVSGGPKPATKTATYTFYAASQMEAMDIAKRMCEWENGAGTVISCGIPKETGKSRITNR